jgi:putative oxidoreductase
MKHLSSIAAALLGTAFIIFGLNYYFNFMPMPADPSPESAPHKLFIAAFYPTGYLGFVKTLEILGGLLVILPKTRNLGLLVLGPIIVNIFAYHVFLKNGAELATPPLLVIAALSTVVLWSERKAWFSLIK